MGDRGQVCIQFPDTPEEIYLYTHWTAHELKDTIRTALAKRKRWDDPEYLARIIFCEMVKGQEDGDTGFGIGVEKHPDTWRVITVDCQNQKVVVFDHLEVAEEFTFEEFIE